MIPPSVSVVIPAFRSAAQLPLLIERLEAVLNQREDNFEIVVVDDASPDETWKVLLGLKSTRSFLKIARLVKNSGQHSALLCGFSLARGSVIVTMDDDLQHAPEDVPKLVAALEGGYDLAVGEFPAKYHSGFRNASGRMVDELLRRLFELPAGFKLTSFRAVRRGVVDNVVNMTGVFPYVTAMLLSHAGRCINVPVTHQPRTIGESGYTYRRSFRLCFNLLINYSSVPLYVIMVLCFGALTCSGAISAWVLHKALSETGSIPGWASTMITISFFNGLLLFALVIHGLYLSRLTQQVSRSRVGYTIGERHE